MAADEPTVRPCRGEDIDAIIAITEEVFAPFSMDHRIEKMLGSSKGASWIEIKGQAIRGEISDNPEGCFVAEIGGEVVGYVTTAINEPASRGLIPNVAVLGKAQGHGLGRELLLRALEHFRARGLAQAKIETLDTNPVGQHLYPSVGFREVVRQIHYVMPLE